MKDDDTTMLPKTDEPIEIKTTAQKIKELSEQGSMNHRTMIAEAKHTDFMNPYSMSCGTERSANNHTGDYHRCCMVAEQVRETVTVQEEWHVKTKN